MKKVLLIIFVLDLLVLNSCSDGFLSESPPDEIAKSQLTDLPKTVRGLVNGLYRGGRAANFYNSSFGGSNAMMGGYMSGFFDNEAKGEIRQGAVAQNLNVGPEVINQFLYNWWSGQYDVISRANTALEALRKMDSFSEKEKQRLMAEVKFFRALNYFSLVKNFGDVPLILKPVDSFGEGLEISRTSTDSVYIQIVKDLNWSIERGGLANVPFPMNNYRVTKGAVATLLANVHLQMAGFPLQATNHYAQAADAARSVIKSGQYALVENGSTREESAYNKMRTSDTDHEYIYGIEYNGDIASNDLPGEIIPGNVRPPGIAYGRTFNVYRPIKEFAWIYDPDADLRIQEKQLFYTSIEKEGTVFKFGERAPYFWYEREAIFQTGRGKRDIRVYRYAEVLLIAAEAIARSEGVTSEAISYLADVRNRAYWQIDRSEIVSSLKGLSEQQFVQEVWKERLRELALNFKIWSDIQRTRKYPVPSEDNRPKVTFVDVIGASNNWGETYEKYQLLYPIPNSEMHTNPALDQNPGYPSP